MPEKNVKGDPRAGRHLSPTAPYTVGIMTMDVEGRDSAGFNAMVARAVEELDAAFRDQPLLKTETMAFHGPHLTPGAGNYAPLDFLEIGLAEKLERDLPFLLIVTEVDLSSSSLAYTLALPSHLTNIAVISTRRLDPSFWGDGPDPQKAALRLARLLLHCFGHLVLLRHEPDRDNVMYPLEGVADLDRMGSLNADQLARLGTIVPREARQRSTREGKLRFIARTLLRNRGAIIGAVAHANPIRLLAKMPTMIAAALSVIVVLLFSAETWDVAAAVSMPQILGFAAMSLGAAAFVLYRAFAFDALLSRDRRITEASIVTTASTIACLGLTLLLMFVLFGGLMYGVIISVFPERLMVRWPSDGEATSAFDHLKLGLFLAAMGVLAGSLGGRSDSRNLVRGVLFITENT